MAEHEKQAVNTAPADVEVGSAEDVEAVMKKYDRESNVRIWTGFPARLVRYGMALFMLTMIWVSMFSTAEWRCAAVSSWASYWRLSSSCTPSKRI